MNAIHVHLMLTHVPVLGTVFGLGLLLVALWRRSDEVKKVALGVFVLAALFAVPVYLTGEPAEDGVKGLPGVTKAVIEDHEEAAEVAFTSLVILGVGALAGLFFFRRGKAVPGWFGAGLLAAALVVGGLMIWTANLGGRVRHTEIRSQTVPSAGGR
jgi:hypothetical protein